MPAVKPVSREEKRARREEIAKRAASGSLGLPNAVKELRQSLGMTQAVFAKHFGMTRIQVIELENGKANPTLETLLKIGRPFGLRVGFIPEME